MTDEPPQSDIKARAGADVHSFFQRRATMTRSCRSSSPSGSSKRVQPAAAKASQDIPKAACTRKGSFKHSKDGGKSKQFYMWRLRSLLPSVSGQDKVTEVRLDKALCTCDRTPLLVRVPSSSPPPLSSTARTCRGYNRLHWLPSKPAAPSRWQW